MPAETLRLLEEARLGSAAALGELLERYRDQMHAAACRALGSSVMVKESGSDVVQESLLAAVAEFGGFRGGTIEELRAWLTAIVVNRSIDTTRRYQTTSKRRVSRETNGTQERIDVLSDGDPTPSERAATVELQRRVRDAVARLPELERRIVQLRYMDKLSFPEIAVRVGCSAFQVRRIWYRALRSFQHEFGGLE